MLGRNVLSNNLAAGYDWLTPSREELNLLDFHSTRYFLRDNKPDFIVHAAGRVGGIQANLSSPSSFLIENLDIGRNILIAAAELKVPRLINFGSTCMYPRDRDEPLREIDLLSGPLEPTNEGYALAKIMVARLSEYLCKENSALRYKTLVPCNLYGPYDKFHPDVSHMIPAVIRKLHLAKKNGDESVEIWGNGQARREFLYVGDLVEAVFKAIRNFDDMPDFLNIGFGIDYTIDEYYKIIAKVIGYEGNFYYDLKKPTGMQRKLSSIELALKWGWRPRHSLENGIGKTYEFFMNQGQNDN